MDRRVALGIAIIGAVIGLSLIGAPLSMNDWSERHSFSVESADGFDPGQAESRYTVLSYSELSPNAKAVFDRTLADFRKERAWGSDRFEPQGHIYIYGTEEVPGQFEYPGDTSALYYIQKDGTSYRFSTGLSVGFGFVYIALWAPFVVYGALLTWLSIETATGAGSIGGTAVAGALGVLFHLLGPEFGFPIVDEYRLAGLATVSALGLVGFGLWLRYQDWFRARALGSPLA